MAKIRITQVRGLVDRPQNQRRTITALGLGRIDRSVELEATPQVMGMVNRVKHLVKVEEVK